MENTELLLWNVFENQGKKLPSLEFDEAIELSAYNVHLFIVTKDGKKGVYNLNEELILPIVFDEILPFVEMAQCDMVAFSYFLCVRKNDKFGLYNCDGKLVMPQIYDEMQLLANGTLEEPYHIYFYLKVEKNGKFGLINLKGRMVLPIIYDAINLVERLENETKKIFFELTRSGYFEQYIDEKNLQHTPKIKKKYK